MPKSTRFPRRDPVMGERKPPLEFTQPMERYKALHGNKIRQYSSIGDPNRDRDADGRLRFLVIFGFCFMVLFSLLVMKYL